MAKIKGSVGRKGNNEAEDVKTVQSLLNGLAKAAGFAKLQIDGICGPKTEGAIVAYQAAVFPEDRATGLIAAGSQFFKILAGGLKLATEEKRKVVEKAVEDPTSTFGKAAGEALRKVIETPAKTVAKIVETIIKVVSRVVTLMKRPRDMLKQLASYLKALSRFISTAAMKTAEKALKAAQKTLATIQAVAKDFPGFLKNLLKAIKDGNRKFIENFVTHLAAGLERQFALFKQFLKDIEPVETVFGAIAKAKKLLGTILPFLKDVLKSVVDLQMIRNEVLRIMAFEKSLLKQVRSIAESMVDTVVKSVNSMAKITPA